MIAEAQPNCPEEILDVIEHKDGEYTVYEFVTQSAIDFWKPILEDAGRPLNERFTNMGIHTPRLVNLTPNTSVYSKKKK